MDKTQEKSSPLERICVSVGASRLNDARRQLQGLPLAEVRLDRIEGTPEELGALCAGPGARIATCRPGRLQESARIELLTRALDAGAAAIDLELDAREALASLLRARARAEGRCILFSFHDTSGTPTSERLRSIVQEGFERGADMVKVACLAQWPEQAARLLGLFEVPGASGRLVVVALGAMSGAVRLASLLLGAPFTYAAPDWGERVLDDQPRLGALIQAFEGALSLDGGGAGRHLGTAGASLWPWRRVPPAVIEKVEDAPPLEERGAGCPTPDGRKSGAGDAR